MNCIPAKLKKEISNDPFYRRCCISGALSPFAKIDWHHNLIFAGRQVNEKWCILPLAKTVHDNIVAHKQKCDWIMLNRATDDELRRHSKAIDYFRYRDKLNEIFGIYTHPVFLKHNTVI